MYSVCPDCAKIVRLNKPLFGSIHICSTEAERATLREHIAAAYDANFKRLHDAH